MRRSRSTTWLTVATYALRGYLAFVWLRFGLMKLESGWLTTNPLEPLLMLVGAGQLPTTAPGYAPIARMLVATNADALLSIAIPFTEIAIGLMMISGIRVRTAAIVACMLNANLLMAGVANWSLDGRMLVLQAALVCTTTMRGAPSQYAARWASPRAYSGIHAPADG